MEILIQVGIVVLLLVIGGGFGYFREQLHLRRLDEREAEQSNIVVTDLRQPPPGMRPEHATLVVGDVVVATDYLKRFLASLRNILGGEMRSYRRVMDRGRREARLRMLDEAASTDADLVINVRFATSIIMQGAAEVICYGTAVRLRDEHAGADAPTEAQRVAVESVG